MNKINLTYNSKYPQFPNKFLKNKGKCLKSTMKQCFKNETSIFSVLDLTNPKQKTEKCHKTKVTRAPNIGTDKHHEKNSDIDDKKT